MYLTNGDMFAVLLALGLLNITLVLAFRRVYVLEKEATRQRRQIRKLTDGNR